LGTKVVNVIYFADAFFPKMSAISSQNKQNNENGRKISLPWNGRLVCNFFFHYLQQQHFQTMGEEQTYFFAIQLSR
jgi:hypothetical protein